MVKSNTMGFAGISLLLCGLVIELLANISTKVHDQDRLILRVVGGILVCIGVLLLWAWYYFTKRESHHSLKYVPHHPPPSMNVVV
jgi:membrane protein DedA with SNARE-associated domain